MKSIRRNLLGFTVFISLLFAGCSQQSSDLQQMQAFIDTQNIDQSMPDWKRHLNKPPQMKFDPGKRYLWQLKTNRGVMTVELMPEVAPMHVSSTIYLTMLGFYDKLPFHRVIPGFMAQGGDPMGNGMGGPGYKYRGEFDPTARHDKAGVLSMANAGPGTDGSQFFITFKPTPHLNGRHTVFGHVIEGMDVLKRIEALGTGSGRTQSDIIIEKATIVVKDKA